MLGGRQGALHIWGKAIVDVGSYPADLLVWESVRTPWNKGVACCYCWILCSQWVEKTDQNGCKMGAVRCDKSETKNHTNGYIYSHFLDGTRGVYVWMAHFWGVRLVAMYVVDLCMLCCFCKIYSWYFVDKTVFELFSRYTDLGNPLVGTLWYNSLK